MSDYYQQTDGGKKLRAEHNLCVEMLRSAEAECKELLAALRGLVEAADYDSQDSGWYSEQSIKALEVARAAIAKAEKK
jgi:predicted nucleic acid-binding Zn ribbon protein